MRIETVLNHCYKHKSFIYTESHFEQIGGKQSLVVKIMPRKNGLAECSKCGKASPVYDHLDERRFDFVPLWNIPVCFRYRMRRIKCSEHGVKVERERKAKTLLRFFRDFGRERCAKLEFVCSDMWKPYVKVIAKKASNALHILDRFHIVQHLSKSIDKIRAEEVRTMAGNGYDIEVLKNTKYCFLKNEKNLTQKQKIKLDDVLKYDLKSVRAYLLKESFQLFWTYKSSYWAEWYLRRWCARAMRSRLKPIKDFVKMLRRHQPLIMNWFKAKKAYSSGVVEGLNRKINLVTRKAYGFRSYEVLKIALFHTMGELPEPEFTHKFC